MKMHKPIRILLTQDTDWLKRYPGQQHHIAERLSLRGYDIRVIDYEILWRKEGKRELISKRHVYDNVSKIIKNANITVIRPSILKIPIMDYMSMVVTYSREIYKQIEEFDPEVIIGHSILSNYISMRLSKKKKIPFIFHMTDAQHTIIPYKMLQPLGKILESSILRNSDGVIVINEKLKEYAVRMGANPKKTYVIKAGLDFKRFDPSIYNRDVRYIYNIKENDLVLLFMGWLYHFSGLKELVLELSRSKVNSVKMLIVGDGDAFNDIKKIVNNFNLNDRVILTGKQSYDKIPKFIAAADVCLLPAYPDEKTMQDIVPIKMYEYMAMGKPVIATRLPGVMKEFGTDNGVIYIDKPEDALHKALELRDSNIIESEGKKARKFVERNDWERVTDEFEMVLEEVVSAGV